MPDALGPFLLNRVHCADCVEAMKLLPDGCVDAVVTDPPYEIGFMGKNFDKTGIAHRVETWAAALRVAKPGAHLLAFGGTRTFHRLACAIEDAGWEIRDCVMWVYGSGFPKSLDVSKAIDKAAGCVRPRVPGGCGTKGTISTDRLKPGEAISGEAIRWQGWGTALKPAWEPIIVARKPLEGTVAANVLKHGTGAMNIDGSRVGVAQTVTLRSGSMGKGIYGGDARVAEIINPPGRFPANLIHDGSAEVLEGFPQSASGAHVCGRPNGSNAAFGKDLSRINDYDIPASTGSAARFFYTAKADKQDRGKGNDHPTVKPLDLMRYLVRLVTPPGGIVLDPFAGSGSTGVAALQLGFRFIGFDLDAHYAGDICAPRLEAAAAGLTLAEHREGQGQLFGGRRA
jgi:site-specific DNA-methyltransferase (adenine-specific)